MFFVLLFFWTQAVLTSRLRAVRFSAAWGKRGLICGALLCVQLQAQGPTFNSGRPAPQNAVAVGTNASRQLIPTPLKGTDTALMTAGVISGVGAPICTDANLGATTVACGGLGNVVNALAYGVVPDGKYVIDATVTSGSQTVTCPNADCNFTIADMGKIVFATYGAVTGYYTYIQGVLVVPQGTITGVGSSNSITVSIAATATHVATAVLIWGTDNTTALAAAWTAAIAGPTSICLPLYLPAGLMLDQSGQFNSAPAACTNTSSGNRTGTAVYGQGQGVSQIVVTPNFNFSTCAGSPWFGCFGNNVGSTQFFGGTQFRYWSIWGGGYAAANPTSTQYMVVANSNSVFEDFAVLGFGSTGSHLGCANLYGDPVTLINFQCDGVGGLVGWFIPSFAQVFSSGLSYSGDTLGTSVSLQGLLQSSNNIFGPSAQATGIFITSTAQWFSANDQYLDFGGTGYTTAEASITNGGYAAVTNGFFNNSRDGATSVVWYNTGGTARFSQTKFNALVSAASSYVIYQGNGVIYDDCGNSLVNGHIPYLLAAGYLAGSCSATGTALVTANVALTSGWGTSTVSAPAGASHAGVFTVTTGGVPGASPVVTLTFPTPFWVPPASCTLLQIGGTFGTITNPSTGTPTISSVAWTFSGTPIATQVYTFSYQCGP
jgi:hypothetical protein